MSTNSKCTYEKNACYSPDSKKSQPFHCPETPLSSGFCKFHDENYLVDHESEIAQIINTKLEESKKSGHSFNCITS